MGEEAGEMGGLELYPVVGDIFTCLPWSDLRFRMVILEPTWRMDQGAERWRLGGQGDATLQSRREAQSAECSQAPWGADGEQTPEELRQKLV